MKKPRILFITPLPPPVHGSGMVSKYIQECKELGEAASCDFVNLSTSRNIDEIGKRSINKYIRFIAAYFITLWKLLTHRYSLCYLAISCRDAGFLKDAPFVLLCKLFGRKIVIHQHNKGMSLCVDRAPYKWLLPIVYRGAKVILLSWHLYPDIEKIVKREQVVICPNGIPELFAEEPHFSRNNAVPQLLFLSNLIETKGVYHLLDACKILKEKGYKFCCNFVGGESKQITKEIFEKEIENRGLEQVITYHGPQYGKDKEKHLENADIFVHPTKNDAFPLVLLEAMQHKLPIVTTNEGGIPDIVETGVNGIICPQKEAQALATAIEEFITDKSKSTTYGKKGYDIYKSRYTLKGFEKNITKILIDNAIAN